MSVLVKKPTPKLRLFKYVGDDLVEDQNVHVLKITAASHGSRSYSAFVEVVDPHPDYSGIQVDTPYKDTQLISLTVGEWAWIFLEPDPSVDPEVLELVFVGYVLGSPIEITRDGEPSRLELRFDSWLMGQITKSLYSAYTTSIETTEIDMPLVFNPILDGRIFPNQFLLVSVDPVDPEPLLWYPDAKPPTGEELTEWDAFNVLKFLVTNYETPGTFDLDFDDCAVLDGQLVSDIKFERGMGLADAIDHLLLPMGYDWSFTPIDNEDDPRTFALHLRVWSQVAGFAKLADEVLVMPEFDSQTSLTLAPLVDQINGSIDLADSSANRFLILGDFIRKEGTFELIKAWDEDKEDQDIARYQVDSAYWQTDPEYARVYRDFVLNESHKYEGEKFDAADFFGSEEVTRPRRFYPTISLGEDGQPFGREKGYHIEYFDGLNWLPLTEPMDILTHECGIRLTRHKLAFHQMRGDLQLRITATLESDQRLTVDSGLVNSSLPEEKLMQVDTADRFKKQTRDAESALAIAGLPSAEVDDTELMNTYLEQIKTAYSKARMELSIRTNRIDLNPSLLLGQRVEEVGNHSGGRHLGLASNPEESSFPVITAVVIDVQEQSTTLMLDGKTR